MEDQHQHEEEEAPVPGTGNPMFDGAPARAWRMSMDPVQMAAAYIAIISWIVNTVIPNQAAADNHNVPQVVTQEVNGNVYTFNLTAENGFFRIVMIPPADWDDLQQPLHLIFSCRDLYLLGFLHGDRWIMFDDAILNGSGHLDHPQAFQRLENIKGAYIDSHFSSVLLGGWYLYLSYDTLMHYVNRPRQEIRAAVFRIITAISEACRFAQWRSRVQDLLANMEADTVDNDDREFSELFKYWRIISKRARRGAARFAMVPGDIFPTFESLLQALHNGVALSRPPANQL